MLLPTSAQGAYTIMKNMMAGKYKTEEIVDFLASNNQNPPSQEVMSAYLQAIKDSASYTLNSKDYDKPMLDIAGTGGDGHNTANISTLAALICAATELVKVAKYGNRSASGTCGSMDVLEALGVSIECSKGDIDASLSKSGFAPLFARSCYPGGKFVAEARTQLGAPSIFNILFPIARPITGDVSFLFGIAKKELMDTIADMYVFDKTTRCLLVHGTDGMDEVSITGDGTTDFILVDAGQTSKGTINVKELFNIDPVNMKDIQIDSKEDAVALFRLVLDPKINDNRTTAVRSAALVNAAAALFATLDTSTDVTNMQKYYTIAKEVIHAGNVQTLLTKLIKN